MQTLDQTDIKILDLLQQDARMQIKQIAGLVHKTPSPTHTRIMRLQRLGYIERYVAILNRRLLGKPVMMVTLVKLKEHGTNALKDFAAYISQFPEVMTCLHLSGEFDYLLQVALGEPAAYEEFLAQKLCVLHIVDKVHSSLVLKECKMMATIPLA